MQEGRPSATAFGAACHRAVHQEFEGGAVFADPLAWSILGVDPAPVLARARGEDRRGLRLFIAARHRFAEDHVHAAASRGVGQVVVLGAGLDTFAYRHPELGVQVYEVDFPATGVWKRDRLSDARIAIPDTVTSVGVDFERDDLMTELSGAGFDSTSPAIVMWLGVLPYLSRSAVVGTLSAFGAMADSEIVFDYSAPLTGDIDADAARASADLRARTAAVGEPLSEPIPPARLHRMLGEAGFRQIDDLDRPRIRTRILGVEPAGDSGGGHIVAASTATSA